MNSLFTLYPAAWQTDSSSDQLYQVGNAAGWLSRGDKHASTSYPLSGRLYLAKSGWLLLSVPNALVRGVFDAMTAPGAELPLAGTMNVPNVEADVLNAHISVMTADEVASIGANKINERGHHFGYSLGPVHEIDAKNIDGVSKVWAIQVGAPGLSALRKSYGLSPLPKDQPFHITVAVRRKHVLGNNEVSKFDAAPGRGELKAAGAYNFEGEVQGVSMRKTLHKILDELKRPGLMYNNARTGEARAVLPGHKKQQQEVLDLLRQRLADRAKENARLTGRPGEAKIKKPLQEGVDYKITPLPAVRERMHNVTMTPEDIQSFIRSQGFNRLAAERPDYQKQWLGERYRLQPDSTGNLTGAVPSLAKKQLFRGEPVYDYQLVPGWNDEKAAADLLPGGQADNVPDSEFPESKLQEGAEHEHEHTSNDQVAKEIAKDHLSEDPQYYEKQEALEKESKPQILKELLEAKEHSDNKRYEHKAAILRRLMQRAPQDWVIDDPKPRNKGVTHTPTKFKFHTPPETIPPVVKAAKSVYFDQLKNMMVSREPFVYDYNKPVFANIQNQMKKLKQRGDWILQARRNQDIYRAAIDPKYRHQLAMQAFHGTMPQPAYIDQLIERYGDNFLGAPQ